MVRLRVWGDYACFSRPGMVDRVSYPVLTPTAAAGILRAIFGKPEFEWRVQEIAMLKPVRYLSVMRNELKFEGATGAGGVNIEQKRDQRRTKILRDVAYLITADIEVMVPNETVAKYEAQFLRRVTAGQCYTTPCLGCREFIANWSLPDGTEQPVFHTEPLGWLPLEVDFREGKRQRTPVPQRFLASLERGVLRVPQVRTGAAA